MSVSRRTFAAALTVSPLITPRLKSEGQAAPTNPVPGDAIGWLPNFFDSHQLSTVAVLAELIIPKTDTAGALDALVHQHLDRILAASPEAAQSRFLEGLWWLDGYCLRSAAKPFKDIPTSEQLQILTQLLDASDPLLKPGQEFVAAIKAWTARIYYSTEVGQQELNKENRVPAQYVRPCNA